MRRLFLLRHGHPDFPLGTRLCLGSTDLPLGALGRMQACRAAMWMGNLPIDAVYASPLSRAQETARFFLKPVRTLSGLREMDAGDWDGLTFAEIRQRWPEAYAARGEDPGIPIPNGEPAGEVRLRAEIALRQALAETRGDLLLVTHRFVIRTLLGKPEAKIPYGSVTVLNEDGGGLSVEAIGQADTRALDERSAEALLTVAAPGARIEAHCRAVAAEAARIADALPCPLNRSELCVAALLHDVAREKEHHAQTAADWLRALGETRTAELVAHHHDNDGTVLDEAAVLFLADKCVLEDQVVSLDERFARSAAKCSTREARATHARRYAAVIALREKINAICRREVVS